MMSKKLRYILPPLLIAGAVVYGLMPHYTPEEERYYRALFCAIDHQDEQKFTDQMEYIVENGNTDYALHQYHYISGLGEKMLKTWQRLSPEEKAAASGDKEACFAIFTEKQR